MALSFGIPDGLADVLDRLRRVAPDPQVPRHADADEDVVIEAEIDLAGLR